MDGGVPCPFYMLIILEIKHRPRKTIKFNGCTIQDAGHYALGHFAVEGLRDTGPSNYPEGTSNEGNLAHVDQKVVHRIPKYSLARDESKRDGFMGATPEFPPTLQ